MKTLLLLLISVFSVSLAAQTNNGYGLKLHVTGTRVDENCSVNNGSQLCHPTQVLQVLVEGRRFELRSMTMLPKGLVALGDYEARLAEEKQRPTNEFTRQYTIRFSDGSTRTFDVIGETEASKP